MPAVAPGDVLSPTNPILHTYTAAAGVLADPFTLSFAIYDVRDEDAAPVLVYPVAPATQQAVDLELDRIGLGHFAARWTAAADLPTGRYEIRWYLTQTDGAAALSWRRPFEVLAQVTPEMQELYALIADVRDEGVGADVKNRRIAEALQRAAALIRRWTGRDFFPRYKTVRVDARSSPVLPLDEPICAIESVAYAGSDLVMSPESYVVYNRHLSQGLFAPDDRDSPRIEIHRVGFGYPFASIFQSGAQEVWLKGVFGYTDPEPGGSPVGVTPAAIRRVAVLLALRELPKQAGEASDAFDATNGKRVKRMRTREQEVEYFDRRAAGAELAATFTGDEAIDGILLSYVQTLWGTGV